MGQHNATGVTGDAHATYTRGCMRPDRRGPLLGINQVRIGRTKPRVADHVVGINKGKAAVVGSVEE